MNWNIPPVVVSGLMDAINAIFVAVILPLAITWVNNHVTKDRRLVLDAALNGGIKAAVSHLTTGKSATETLKAAMLDPDIRASIKMLATDYVNNNVPTIVAKLGVKAGLPSIVEGRIDDVVAGLADNFIKANTAITTATATAKDTNINAAPLPAGAPTAV